MMDPSNTILVTGGAGYIGSHACKALAQAGGACAAYYLGNGQGFSVREVIALAQEITGREIPVVLGSRRPGDPPRLVADASRAWETLGWQARYHSLEATIESAWQWHQKFPAMSLSK